MREHVILACVTSEFTSLSVSLIHTNKVFTQGADLPRSNTCRKFDWDWDETCFDMTPHCCTRAGIQREHYRQAHMRRIWKAVELSQCRIYTRLLCIDNNIYFSRLSKGEVLAFRHSFSPVLRATCDMQVP